MKNIKKKKTIIVTLRSILLFACIWILCNAVTIWNYGAVDEKTNADVAIVLGAGTWNGQVSPVFKERLNHGIWLYEQGYVKKLLLTGGYGEGNAKSDAYNAKLYAVSQGVPEEDILLEEKSTITQENLKYAKEIMEENGYKTAIVVSDPLHMKRAMLMAEDVDITAYSSPTPTTRYVSTKTKVNFLSREVFFYMGYQLTRLFLPA